MGFLWRSLGVCLSLFWLAMPAAGADVRLELGRGLQWLQGQVRIDGSVASEDASLANAHQVHTEVALSLRVLGVAAPVALLDRIAAESLGSAEAMGRAAVALGDLPSSATLLDALQALQHPDGGAAPFGGYQAGAIDSAWAARALGGRAAPAAALAIAWLVQAQADDGSWSMAPFSPVYVTAIAMSALRDAAALSPATANSARAAIPYLLSKQQADGSWGDSGWLTALVYEAVHDFVVDPVFHQGMRSWLLARQSADGSWGQEVFTSAIALRALALTAIAPHDPTLGSLRVQIADAVTGAPLSGVLMMLSGAASQSASSDGAGVIQFTGLPPGSYSASLSQVGYASMTISTVVLADQSKELGRLLMARAATGAAGATISGIVFDRGTGLPLPMASIRLSDSATQALTDAQGRYLIANAPSGSYTVTAEKTGYGNEAISLAAVAGQEYVFSPSLSPVAQEPASLSLQVIDDATSAPLAGVLLNLNGPTPQSALTDAGGFIRLANLAAGAYSGSLRLAGYSDMLVSVALNAKQALELGQIRMPRSKGDAHPDSASLSGLILDAVTRAPLPDVTINVAGAGLQAATDAAGQFSIPRVMPGTYTVSASKAGYAQMVGTLNAAAGNDYNFSPTLSPLRSDVGANTCKISGRLLRSSDGQPVAGAAVLLQGANSGSMASDASGAYLLTRLAGGLTTITITADGYDAVTGTLMLACSTGASLTYSPRLFPQGSSQPTSNTASLSFALVNAATGTAITGAPVTATPQGQAMRSFVTDASGRFTVDRLKEVSVRVDVSLPEFEPLSLSYQTEALQARDLGQLRLRPVAATTLLPDLSLANVKRATAATDPQSLQLSGNLEAVVRNGGAGPAPASVQLTAFLDVDRDGKFDPAIDRVLGRAALAPVLAVKQNATVSIQVSGSLPFRDAPIHVMVDSDQQVPETNETDNVKSTADSAQLIPPFVAFKPVVKWAWDGATSPYPEYSQVMMSPVVGRLVDTNGDGKVDPADTPVIVFTSFNRNGGQWTTDGVIRVTNGRTGQELFAIKDGANPISAVGGLALADLDHDGKPELIATTQDYRIVVYRNDGTMWWVSPPVASSDGYAPWGSPTVADLDGDGSPEVMFGAAVYSATGQSKWTAAGPFVGSPVTGKSRMSIPIAADLTGAGQQNLILGGSVYSATGQLIWQARDGHTGVADFDGDGQPSVAVAVVNAGTLSLYSATGLLRWTVPLPGGGVGGPPTIADVDGDGTPEIGVAASSAYTVFRRDGSVLWSKASQDYSSQVTGSTVFDFDGNGSAEVLYADEVRIRAFKGATGEVLWDIPNSSGTANEYPLVVDTDGDGHADLVAVANDYYTPPNATALLHGVRVFHDQDNHWVSTREVWNQHAYSINNINDDLSVPAQPSASWKVHNSYRANKRIDVSPTAVADLTASSLRIADNGPQAPSVLSVRVGNGGALAAPAGIKVAFYGVADSARTLLGVASTPTTMAVGGFDDVSLTAAAKLAQFTHVTIVVDDDGSGKQAIADFDRANNELTLDLAPLVTTLGLALVTDAAAYQANQAARFTASVTNGGSFAKAARLRYVVQTSDGQAVATLPIGEVLSLASGASLTDLGSWNTGNSYAGAYRVLAELLDAQSERVFASASASFALLAGDSATAAGLSAALQLDKASYSPGDTVYVIDRVSNLFANHAWHDLDLRTSILNPDGSTRWSATAFLRELGASGLQELRYNLPLSNAPAGEYQARVVVTDAGGAVLAQSVKRFSVASSTDSGVGLMGHLTVSPRAVFQGDSASFAIDLANHGNAVFAELPLAVNVVEPGTGQLLGSLPVTVASLASGASYAGSVSWTANAPVGSQLVAVLTAQAGGRSISLAQDSFVVSNPPVTARLQAHRESRSLALVSCPPGSDGGVVDQVVAGGEAACAARRGAALAQALSQFGAVNKVVTTRAEFESELRCGAYNTYWISGGSDKLSDDVVRELIEAIRRGDSLILDGSPDARNQLLYPLAGVELSGGLSQADQNIIFGGGADFPAGSLATLGRASRFKLVGAQLQASFAQDAAAPALTTSSYGQGRSVLAAFELARMLEQSNDQRRALLGSVLQFAASSSDTIITVGAPVALAIDVSNAAGQSASAQVQVSLPAGLEPLPGQTTSWTLNLAAGQTQSLVLRIKAQQGGEMGLDVIVNAGSQTSTVQHSVRALSPETIASQAYALTQALGVSSEADITAKANAAQAITQAQVLGGAGRYDEALSAWLQAASALQALQGADAQSAALAAAQALQGAERALCPQLACLSGSLEIRQGEQVVSSLATNANAKLQREVRNSCPSMLPGWHVSALLRNRRSAQSILQLESDLSLEAGGADSAQGAFLAGASGGQVGDTLEALLYAERLGWQLHLGRITVPLTGALICDVDGNGVINRTDVLLIREAVGQTVPAGDPRDPNGDHLITVNDVRGCVLRCTKPSCEL